MRAPVEFMERTMHDDVMHGNLLQSKGLSISIDHSGRHQAWVEDAYYERFGTTPSPVDILLIARRDAEVIGTLGLEFGWRGSMGFERAFDTTADAAALLARPHVELGRWLGTPGEVRVSDVLVYAGAQVALALGRDLAFVEQKPILERLLRRLGVELERVPAELAFDRIPAHDRAFYEAEPRPVLNAFDLRQAVSALEPAAAAFRKIGILHIDTSRYQQEDDSRELVH